MLPKRVTDPSKLSKPSGSQIRPKSSQLDWDSPSSYTGTIKRRYQSPFNADKVKSTIPFLKAPLAVANDDIDNNINHSGSSTEEGRPNHFIKNNKNILDTPLTSKRITRPEIVQGNCNLNEKLKGNELGETVRNDDTSNNETTNAQLTKKSKLKLPNRLINKYSQSIRSSADTVTNKINQSKLLFSEKTTANFLTKRSGSAAETGKQILTAIKNPQVQRIKENSASIHNNLNKSNSTEQQKQQQPQQLELKQPVIGNVTVATALIVKQQTGNKYKLNEFNKNKNKSSVLQKNDGNSISTADAALEANETSNKKYFSKQLPQGNKLKFQDFASSTIKTTTAAAPPPSAFTELYRDFPVNYALTTVIESIPLKPPPYCNPPAPPAPSVIPSFFHRSSQALASPACIEFETKIRLEKENEKFQLKINDNKWTQQSQRQTKELYQSTTSSTSKTNVQPDNSCTEVKSPHRIANEIRLKGSFALQKLTNISRLNGKNNRLFSVLKFPNEYANEKADTHHHQGKNTEKNGIARDNLNDYVLLNPIRQSDISKSNSNSGASIKMDTMASTTTKKSPPCDILAKPEFSSSLFQNIPVRPRKGVPHLENYCLFDPSKDFVNEKELKKKEKDAILNNSSIPFKFSVDIDDEELIEEIIYEDQLVYDTLEEEAEESDSANYFTIDPDYVESKKAEGFCMLQPIAEADIEESFTNSVDSSSLPFACTDHINARDTSIKTHSPLITSNNRVILKKSPQIDKLFRQSSLPTATSRKVTTPPRNESSSTPLNDTKWEGRRFENHKNFPPSLSLSRDKSHSTPLNEPSTNQMLSEQTESLKQSVSLPQLNNIDEKIVKNNTDCCTKFAIEPNYAQFNSVSVNNKSHKIRHTRPLSSNSDADSGFLSPVTPTESSAPNGASAHTNNAPAVLFLQQCDSIQGYIEVSLCVCIEFKFHLITIYFVGSRPVLIIVIINHFEYSFKMDNIGFFSE